MERDFIGYGRNPPDVTWPGLAKLAVSFVVNYEEGAEYSIPDGDDHSESHGSSYSLPKGVRDLRSESTFEYGSRVGIWRVMRIFERAGIKITFFASARALERNTEVAALIREQDHEPAAHGWRWIDAWNMSEGEERESIRRAVQSIASTCGTRPVGWNTRGAPSVNTRRLLVEEGGFLYDSDSTNDDLPFYVKTASKQHLIVPYTRTLNDGRFASQPGFSDSSTFLDECRRGVSLLHRESKVAGKMVTIGLHSRLIGEASRADALEALVEYVLGLDGVWIARRDEIANYWLRSFPPSGGSM